MNSWTPLPQLRTRKGLANSPPNWPPWSRTCRAIPGSPASSKLWQVMQLLRSLLVTRPKQESMLLKRLTKMPSKKHLLELTKLSSRKSKNKFVRGSSLQLTKPPRLAQLLQINLPITTTRSLLLILKLQKKQPSCKQNSSRRANIVLLAARQRFSAPKSLVNLMPKSTTCNLRLQSLKFHSKALAAM